MTPTRGASPGIAWTVGRTSAGGGKCTASNHPTCRGSRTRGGAFQHALYRRPADEALAALPTAQILDGGLKDQDLELVWLDDASAALTAHIEGSARVELDEGG